MAPLGERRRAGGDHPRVEALLEANDLAEGTRQLGAPAGRMGGGRQRSPDKSQALWERFRTARERAPQALRRLHGGEPREEAGALRAVAGVGESTGWNETADLIRRVQAEWKAIGPVPGGTRARSGSSSASRATASSRAARSTSSSVDAERRENAQQKMALCEQAEALADSTRLGGHGRGA